MLPPQSISRKIGYKNHHSVNNPYAQFQESYTLDDILASRMIYDPLTKLQCSPTSDGSGAADLLASEAFVDKHGLANRAVEIVGQAMTTDFANSFDGTCKGLIGYHMNVAAAQRVYEQSGVGPQDFQVIEPPTASRPMKSAVRGAGSVRRRRGTQAHRQQRHHLRRPMGGQPVRRPYLAGHPRRAAVPSRTHRAARYRRQSGRLRPSRPHCNTTSGWRRGRRHRLSARRRELATDILTQRELPASVEAIWATISDPSTWADWFTIHEKWLQEPSR